MSEPIVDIAEESLLPAEYTDDYEMATNQLGSGNLTSRSPSVAEEIDWLLKLRTKNLATRELTDDAQGLDLRPSGMSAHSAPARIAPTRGARFTTGLRRGTLMIVLSALVAAALVGGAYLLASTSWLSTLFVPKGNPAPAAPATLIPQEQPAQGIALPAAPANMSESPDAIRNAQRPPRSDREGAGGEKRAPAEASALSGLDARNLRDKGIAAYKAANYTDAVKYLEESINQSSDDPVAQYQLGMAYMAVPRLPEGNPGEHSLDDAELAFRTAVSLQPKWAAPYQMMAETMMRRGYYEQAVEPALQATRLDPTMGEAWRTLGRAYTGAGNEAEATEAFGMAAHYAPTPKP